VKRVVQTDLDVRLELLDAPGNDHELPSAHPIALTSLRLAAICYVT
jgi:hypothetical protein